MNTRKGLWAVVNKATNNLAAHQVDGHSTGLPAIFKTRKMAREYCLKEYGPCQNSASVAKATITGDK